MRVSDWHPNIRIRIFESFLSGSIGAMVYPFMAVYMASRIGEAATGVVMLLNIAAGVVAGMYGGCLADRLGRKKVMAAAEITRFASAVVMAAANAPGLSGWAAGAWITIAMMSVNSVSWGLSGPASNAMLIDVTTPENRKTIYGLTYWTNNLAFAIGGIAGGFLFTTHLFGVFISLAAACLVSSVLVVFFITETYDAPKSDVVRGGSILADAVRSYRGAFLDSVFVRFSAASMLLLSLEFQLSNYVGVRLSQEMGLTALLPFLDFQVDGVRMQGILRTENTLGVVLLAVLVGRWTKRTDDRKTLMAGYLIYAAGYLTVSYSNKPWLLMASMLAATIGELLFVPVRQSYLAAIAPEHARSTYMAVNSLVFRGSMAIASVSITLGGVLPSAAMTLLFAGMAAAGLIMLRALLPELERRKAAGDTHARSDAAPGAKKTATA